MSLTQRVYADDPAQPSGPGHTFSVTINVLNQHHIRFEGADSVERLTIHEPQMLGMHNAQGNSEKLVRDTLLACNLLLKRARLSVHRPGTELADYTPDSKTDGKTVIDESDGPIVVTDTVVFSPVVTESLGIITTDVLDEVEVCGVLDMIQAVYDAENPSMKVDNMKKALDAYSRGIEAHDREMVLKELYAAADMAVNFAKKDRKDEKSGGCLDSAMRLLADDEPLQIDEIRVAVNSLKHASSEQQRQNRPDGQTVYRYVRAMRPATVRIILSRLRGLVGHRESDYVQHE